MNFKLLTDIARSLLMARWRQTLVAAIGVTFGITMFIALLGFMNGLNHLLDGLVVNRTPHVRIYNEIKPNAHQPITLSPAYKNSYNFISSVKSGNSREEIYNGEAIIKTIEQDPRVAGVSAKTTTQVFYNDGAVAITAFINGVDANAEINLFHFKDYVTEGNAMDIKNVSNSVILGKPLAEKLMADIGDVVQVTTAQGERFQLKVVGYYQSGYADFDKTQSFASLATVQKLLGKPNSYFTDIQVKLKDINQAPAVAKEYAATFQTQAEDIQTANEQFETGTSIRTLISYVVGIVLLIVAGFGIFNILNMMIYEKMDTIAILKATGFSGKDVKRIFIYISMGIGIFGGVLGLALGYLLSMVIDRIPFKTAALPTVDTYPVDYNPAFYIIGIIFSLATTYIAGWLPARKASKVDPVIIIRGK